MNNAHHQANPAVNNPYEANPNRVHKLASTRKMTSSSEINQRNPRHNQPPHPTDGNSQPCHRDKKLALTNKHTVEFSNNRHTPTQHHPTGRTSLGATSLIYQSLGVFSNSVIRAKEAGEPAASIMSRHARRRVLLEGDRPGDQPPSRTIETRCPFLPAGRTSRTLHALRPGAKSVRRALPMPARRHRSTSPFGAR